MYAVAAVGDRDSVIGFRALGMMVIETETTTDVDSVLDRLAAEPCAVIFLTEDLAEKHQAFLQRMRGQRLPAVIPIPASQGSSGLGMQQVYDSVRRAIGMNVFEHETES
jgi:V/A-type H+-transporting ATPase subunit F